MLLNVHGCLISHVFNAMPCNVASICFEVYAWKYDVLETLGTRGSYCFWRVVFVGEDYPS